MEYIFSFQKGVTMNKTLLTLLTLTIFAVSALSAAPTYENFSNETIEQLDSFDNKGHITFKVGPAISSDDIKNPLPIFSIGYQSALVLTNTFHSASIEFGTGIMETRALSKQVWYHPKIMGIHYWNPKSTNRLYTAVGSNIASYTGRSNNKNDDRLTEGTYVGASIAVGYEMGVPTGAINKIELGFDQPTLVISAQYPKLQGVATITYAVGF